MRTSRGPGGRSAFFGLAMLILGGLLFAAGVMVGRQMAVDESEKPKEPLFKIDQRDKDPKKPADGGELVYPEVLDKKKPEPKPEPLPPKPDPDPVPDPDPEAAPEVTFTLQVAAYREQSQADALVKKLSSKGYDKVHVVSGDGNGSRRSAIKSTNDMQQRRLAGTGRSNDGYELS